MYRLSSVSSVCTSSTLSHSNSFVSIPLMRLRGLFLVSLLFGVVFFFSFLRPPAPPGFYANEGDLDVRVKNWLGGREIDREKTWVEKKKIFRMKIFMFYFYYLWYLFVMRLLTWRFSLVWEMIMRWWIIIYCYIFQYFGYLIRLIDLFKREFFFLL